jgi:hypothetical protein
MTNDGEDAVMAYFKKKSWNSSAYTDKHHG